MGINLTNFLSSQSKNTKMIDFQDLDHLDGLSISVVSANLYKDIRDDLTMFYFRAGANYASVYTQSKIVSENIKWNINQRPKKIYSLIVNTRNANAFTGRQGYESLKKIADLTAKQLNKKPKRVTTKEFETYIDMLLQGVEEVDAPEGSSKIDQLNNHLEDYCLQRSIGSVTRKDILNGAEMIHPIQVHKCTNEGTYGALGKKYKTGLF